MILLDGKKTSEEIKNEIAEEVIKIREAGGRAPHLAAILVGANPASETYVNNKVLACKKVGYTSSLFRFDTTVSEEELIAKIEEVNNDPDIDGLIVQLPLPAHISEDRVTRTLVPQKDIDGFHPLNIGRMVLNQPSYIPATPYGILKLLERYKIETEGKHCVVIGRSNIVGAPISILMSKSNYPGNCTVTLCHSKTKDLTAICKSADIIIAAIGRADFVTADMVKEGAVIIDVGINRVKSDTPEGKSILKGDVNFEEVSLKCSYITPVPGGVGPMTISMLLLNTLRAYRKEVYN